jgi:hypothetical protein
LAKDYPKYDVYMLKNPNFSLKIGIFRRNEKNGRLKTSENFATMRVCKRFFKMDCKKAPRSAQIVKI